MFDYGQILFRILYNILGTSWVLQCIADEWRYFLKLISSEVEMSDVVEFTPENFDIFW